MDDGTRVPELHDGMGCFQAGNGNYILVRNHEIDARERSPLPDAAYDPGCRGGTTTIELTPDLNVVRHHLSLTGTLRNCSGGRTPWNTWLSCEERFTRTKHHKHGYVFEVDPLAKRAVKPMPLVGLGRFRHEAAGVDANGIVYLTEDRLDSCFYRFIPQHAGDLHRGGTLQALRVKGQDKYDTTRAGLKPGQTLECEWVAIQEPDPDRDSVRYQAQELGAAVIVRGEGLTVHGDDIYFTSANGGRERLGQIFRYTPNSETTGSLTLYYECADGSLVYPDNLAMSPWGDLLVCEDREGAPSSLVGLTPALNTYRIARNTYGEWSGVCFSPDGKFLFANIQLAGRTLAISGLNAHFVES